MLAGRARPTFNFSMPSLPNLPEPRTPNPEPFFSEWPFLLSLTLLGLVVFFYRLGVPGLMDPDEGRYAEIAREIWLLRDWLIPHLNLLPYLEKPPLVYWLTALSLGGLGATELAARLPVALSALGGVFLAYGLGRVFWGPAAGLFSAVVLATSVGYVALGRLLTLDMTFSLLLNLAVGLGYLALRRPRPGRWLWAYLALALAVLTKGPVALVLAGLIWGLGVFLQPDVVPAAAGHPEKEADPAGPDWWSSRWRACRPLVQPRGWVLLAVLVLPWFAGVEWRYPGFFRFFILEQHFGRFLTPAIHPAPFYFYLPVLLGLMLPWSFLLPWALMSRRPDPHRIFLLLWAAVVLVFFSLSRGKLVPYVLPALTPLALLLGRALADLRESWRFGEDPALKHSLLTWAGVGCGLTVLYFWPPAALSRELAKAAPFAPVLLPGLLVFDLTPLAGLLWRRVSLLLLGALLLSALVPPVIDTVSQSRSPREVGLAVKSHWQPGAALVGVDIYSQAVSFYSGQIFHLLPFRTELNFGRRLEPDSGLYLAGPREIAAFAASRPRTLFYLGVQELPALQAAVPGKMRRLARYKDCILLDYEGK
jgi:4-amino-4-deoxy-L-arabinose transferase-like glycosyltransferase